MALQTLTVSAAMEKIENEALTIAGIKTFSSSPIVPAPTTDLQAATKKYVDDAIDTDVAAIGSLFGAWSDKSSSYGAQQAATDGFVLVVISSTSGDDFSIIGYTDANSDPTTIRQQGYRNQGVTHSNGGWMMPVRKSDYWKVVKSAGIAAISVYWLPMGL